MIAFSRWFASLSLLTLLAGCTGSGSIGNTQFAHSFDAVSTGATKNQVRAALGEADNRVTRALRGVHAGNAPPELVKALPPGTPYEVWVYRRGETDYYMYFSSGSGAPVEDWKLVARRSVPHGT
ncbi:MAG TPA: hypothetical protein VH370_06995 [Humisphaera sp.]|jgi:hypothetical protein|nr:hypothetical protein [Humisphaera sp.]